MGLRYLVPLALLLSAPAADCLRPPPPGQAAAARARAAAAPGGRRAAVATTLAAAAALLAGRGAPARAANLAERTDASLELVRSAETSAELAKGLTQLGGLADEYGGLADRQEDVVQKLRTVKTSALWSAEVDAAYREAMRSIDPFRVVAVQPALQTALYVYAPAYVGLTAVQQVVPKFFAPTYAAAALAIFGPIAFAVLNS